MAGTRYATAFCLPFRPSRQPGKRARAVMVTVAGARARSRVSPSTSTCPGPGGRRGQARPAGGQPGCTGAAQRLAVHRGHPPHARSRCAAGPRQAPAASSRASAPRLCRVRQNVKSHGTTPMTRGHPGWPTPTADSAIAVNEQAPARTADASAVATLPWRSARLGPGVAAGDSFAPGPSRSWIGGHSQACALIQCGHQMITGKSLGKDQLITCGDAGAGVPRVTSGNLWTGCE